MKYPNHPLLYLLFSLLLASCQQEALQAPVTIDIQQARQSNTPLLSKSADCPGVGHDTGPNKQYYMDGFTPLIACEANTIKVHFEDCFINSGYEAAIPAALEEFNHTNSSLFFTLVDDIEEAHIFFTCHIGGCCGCANASFPVPDHPGDSKPSSQTFFPSGGSIGEEIEMDVDWTSCDPDCAAFEFDLCFHKHTVMHELMHALGLYHNDTPGVNPIHVPGTGSSYDNGSVINSGPSELNAGNWCNPSCEFSIDDRAALKHLYPLDCDCFWQDCAIPKAPPIAFSNLCQGETICYDFADYPCLLAAELIPSSNKLVVEINGTSMCLTYLWKDKGTVSLKIKPDFLNYKKCGQREWIFNTNSIFDCFFADPGNSDG